MFLLRKSSSIILFVIFSIIFTTACSNQNIDSVISLKVAAEAEIEAQVIEDESFKFAIVSIHSIRKTHRMYYKFINYLEEELGIPVEIIQKQTYSEVKEMFENGELDAGIVCAYLAVIGIEEGILKKISMPIVNEEETFTSYIITRKDSDIEEFDDLQGRSFAFSDPLSYSGYFYTNYDLEKNNHNINTFFSKTYFTYSHDNTILAVANGLVDAGATHSLVYQQLKENNDPLLKKIKIIAEGPYVGNSPIVVNPNIDEDLKNKLKDVIQGMHLNEGGKKALEKLNTDRFVDPDPELFQPIIEMISELGELQ
ncbi:phosphate/phosphite/phosphonate ABC transporter substrate-binding protein [Bacillaceae bacterium IKA-2]|nr:phosphate/phosphite/phosphonate ABC transporter substrate-binding protein [Bacillaceae bacterium IKA-2]